MPPFIVDYFCSIRGPAPAQRLMLNAYPNPFTSSILIEYSVSREAAVSLTVYDVEGRKVRNLVTATKSRGTHSKHWDGRDSRGAAVSSGVYWCVLKASQSTMIRKMLVMR
jgi:flagellar hook assembly protein FlgD